MVKEVLIVAGEASGDHHGSKLVEALLKTAPDIHFSGIGGKMMRTAGVDTFVDSADIAVIGLVEVLTHYKTIFGALNLMREKVRTLRPDLLILIDYPDFNLRLAKTAKEAGVKVLYYISPQIWAWRQKRVFKIGQRVDMMAVVFPFEVPFYENAGVPVRFVGHPLVDEVKSSLTKDEAKNQLGFERSKKVLGLFPGSRISEIKRLMPTILQTAEIAHKAEPDLQFIIPVASTLKEALFAPYLADSSLDIKLTNEKSYDVMRACDAIVAASGTATLEIALMEVPLVVIYKIQFLSYQIMSRMVKVDHLALCNIVANARVAPEFIQGDAQPDIIATHALELLRDAKKSMQMQDSLREIRAKLGESGASKRVAALALELM